MMDNTEPEFMGSEDLMFPKHFHEVRLIGKGTFSSVYSARDTILGRDVAIKAIPNHSESLGSKKSDTKQEIEILSKLNHPGIIRLLDVTYNPGVALLIQPLCAKGGLDQKANSKQLSYLTRLSMIDTLLQACKYLHDQGWLHCDIKPANLLLDNRGSVFLSDFGEARPISRGNGEKEQIGSIGYMAPELLKGHSGPSMRTEIYSIGVTLLELLTGERAFSDDPIIATQVAITTGVPSIKSNLPFSADWNALIQKATNPDAKSRYGSVPELASDVQRIRENKPVLVRRISSREYLLRWIKKEPITAGLLFSVLMIACIGSIASGSAWLEVSKQSDLSKTSESHLLRRTAESIAAKKKFEESIALANIELKNAEINEAETKEAIDTIAALSEELNAQAQKADRLNLELTASVETLEQSKQKRNAAEQKAVTVGSSAAQIESDEYWRLLNQAMSLLELDEIAPAMEALDKTPQSLRRAEYALLRGLVENRWRYPKRIEIGEIEFDEEDDSEKSVALSRDGHFFVRCSREQLKILSVAAGKIDSFPVPKLRGADRVWLRFNEDATKLLIAVTSEEKCTSFSLEYLRGSWVLWGSPIQIDWPCFGVTDFYQGRCYLLCLDRTAENEKVNFVDPATGLTAWDYGVDSTITGVKLVTCGWLPPGNSVLILSDRKSLLVVDDGLKPKEHKVDLALTNRLDLTKLGFFQKQEATNSLKLGQYSPGDDRKRLGRYRGFWSESQGAEHRQGESYQKPFVHEAMPDRNAWIRNRTWYPRNVKKVTTYFVLNGRNGNLCLPLCNKSEGCFPLAISESNELFCVEYPEPSKAGLFNRNSNHLPKASLVRYDFGAKGLDQLIQSSSPFQEKTPLQVLTTRNGPAAPKAQIDFIIDTEDAKLKTSLASIQYRCFAPEGNHSETQKVGFRKRVSVIEPKVTNGTKYQIELDAGNAFEILKMEVELFEGQITELGTLKLKLKPKTAIDANAEFSIIGVVKNVKGDGLANASITAKFLPRGTGARPTEVIQKTTTDKDGKYRLDGIGLGRVTLSVELQGYLIEHTVFSTGYSSTQELAENFSLSRPTRIKLRYAVSEYGSSSLVGNDIETGNIEMLIDKDPRKLFESAKGPEKRFSNFATGKGLGIVVLSKGTFLFGNCAIGTAEQSDFDAITEVEKIIKKDTLLTAGKVLILHGVKSDGARNRKDCCIKIVVESISEY